MVLEKRFKKSSKKFGGESPVRHGTLSRNAVDYQDLEKWNAGNDIETGQADLMDMLSTREQKNLSRLWYGKIVEMRNANINEKVDFVKRLPVSLNTKRFIRDKLNVDDDMTGIGYRQWNKGGRATWRFITKYSFRESFRLFARNYKSIEAEFGSGVLSYFVFLRWLLSLNFRIFLLVVAFIVIPQAVLDNFEEDDQNIIKFARSNGSFPGNTTDISLLSAANMTAYCSELYHTNTQESVDKSDILSLTRDFIQGTGWMEETLLFYGFYSHKNLSLQPTTYKYNLPLAYLLVVVLGFAMSLVLMLWRARKTMRLNNERKRVKNTSGMSSMVFSSWDYALTNPKPVELRKRTIYMELMATMEEERLVLRREERTSLLLFGIVVVRCVINIIILGVLGGAAFLIYYSTRASAVFAARDDYEDQLDALQLLMDFLPSLTITFLNFAIPILFGFLVKAEGYSPTFELNMLLGRTVFLRLASLAILFAALYYELSGIHLDDCHVGNEIMCWETYVGQQIYRLIVLQIAVEFGNVFLLDFPRRKLLSRVEFNISKTVLDLIYCQTLFWLGIFFAPLTCVMSVCHFFILFYLKKFTLLMNYKPSEKPYRSSRSHTFLMVVLICAFVLCCIPVGYSIWALTPSRGCGPFRSHSQAWTVLTETIETFPSVFQEIFSFLFSLGFAIPLFILMAIGLYWFHAVGKSRNEYIDILTHQIEMQTRDKKFLSEKLKNRVHKNVESFDLVSEAKDSDIDDYLEPKRSDNTDIDGSSDEQAEGPEYDNVGFAKAR